MSFSQPPLPTSRRIRALAGASAALLLLTSCGGDDHGAASVGLAATVTSVCDALRAARAGDAEAARRIFANAAHEGLHELAKSAGERDRAVAARLLEAKEKVERAEANDAPAPVLTEALSGLTRPAEAAARTLAVEVVPCSA